MEENKLNKEEIKEKVVDAALALQGVPFFVAAITDEANQQMLTHQECSYLQMGLIIKGMLQQNEMLRMDVYSWLTDKIAVAIKSKTSKN